MFPSLLPAVLLLSTVANASPLKPRTLNTISLTRRQDYDVSTEVQRVRRRYARALGPGASSLQERAGVFGQEGLVNAQDALWYGNVYFGTPPQAQAIDFDTGSSDIVIPTTSCKNCTKPLFNPSLSSTFHSTGTAANVSYGDGSGASGVVATDTVTVAGLAVKGQGFIAANFESVGFSNPNSGILGLAFPSIAQSQATPLFANLVNSGQLYENSFSMYLSRNGSAGSELCLGCSNPTKYTGAINYYPVNAAVFNGTYKLWNIDATGLSQNGNLVTNSFPAAIDSGTSRVLIPTAIAAQLYSGIPNARYQTGADGSVTYFIPCKTILSTAIEIVFGTTAYAINPVDFNGGPVSKGSDYCESLIIGNPDNLAVVGDVFLKNWYSVYQYPTPTTGASSAAAATPSVGFAKAI